MLTETKYNAIVAMIKGGATDQIIMDSQGVNENTLRKVKDSNGSFEKYKQLHSEMLKHVTRKRGTDSRPVQVVEHTQTITMVANHYMMEQLLKQTKLLEIISNKLAVIIDDLYGTKGAANNE